MKPENPTLRPLYVVCVNFKYIERNMKLNHMIVSKRLHDIINAMFFMQSVKGLHEFEMSVFERIDRYDNIKLGSTTNTEHLQKFVADCMKNRYSNIEKSNVNFFLNLIK